MTLPKWDRAATIWLRDSRGSVMNETQIYYDSRGVRVTPDVLRVGSTPYPIASIKAVTVWREHNYLMRSLIMAGVCIAVLIYNYHVVDWTNGEAWLLAFLAIGTLAFFGLMIAVVLVIRELFHMAFRKWQLEIVTAEGGRNVLESTDKAFLDAVCSAVERARTQAGQPPTPLPSAPDVE